MADEAATTSSSPAFGFASVVINPSYQFGTRGGSSTLERHPPRRQGRRLVNEPDDDSVERELHDVVDQPGGKEAPADRPDHVLPDRPEGAQHDPHEHAETQPFLQTVSALVPLRVRVGKREESDQHHAK